MNFINLILLSLCFLLTVSRFLPSPRKGSELLIAFFLWIFFYPTFQALRQNNIEITELFFILLMLNALRLNKEFFAGFFLGMAGATKILPLVLILYFLWRRRLKIVMTSIVTFTSIFMFVIYLKNETFNEAIISWWMHASWPFPKEFQNNQAISGFVWRAFSDFNFTTRFNIEHPYVWNPVLAKVVTYVLTSNLIIIVTVLMLKGSKMSSRKVDAKIESIEIAIVLTTMLLIIPHNHTHYFILTCWVYLASLREWKIQLNKSQVFIGLTMGASYILLGLLHFWRILDPMLFEYYPLTGVDLARLASIPFFGAILCLIVLLCLHNQLYFQRNLTK